MLSSLSAYVLAGLPRNGTWGYIRSFENKGGLLVGCLQEESRMLKQLPVVDDTLAWNALLDLYKVPALSVAIELGIFESLDAQPDSAEGLAARRGYDVRGLRALLPMLMHLGFLCEHGGRYQLNEAGKQYMLKGSL